MKEMHVALVTGANKGIGRETAKRLGKRMKVLIGARDRGRGEEAAARLSAEGCDAHFLKLDVTDGASIEAAAKVIQAEYGQLDVLVNNAAIATGAGKPSGASVAAMHEIYETNVFGVVALTQAVLPLLRRAPAARIVNMCSSLGSLGLASDPKTPIAQQETYFAYASSKTALNAFTVRLAYELRDTPIKVNSACPGFVATDLNHHRGTRTVEEGAAIAIHLATLPADGPTGGFFNDAGVVMW